MEMKKAITASQLRTRKMQTVDLGDGAVVYMRKPSAAFGLRMRDLVKSLDLVDSEGNINPAAQKDPRVEAEIVDMMNGYLASHVCDEEGETIWKSAEEMMESDIEVWELLTGALHEMLGLSAKKPSEELAALVEGDGNGEVSIADVPLGITPNADPSCESPITSLDE